MPSLIIAPLAFSLLSAPASTDRGAASVEVADPPAEAPADSASTPAPAPEPAVAAPPAPAPTAMPMPVPVAPPPSTGAPPPGAVPADEAAKPAPRKRVWPERPIKWRVDLVAQIGSSVIGDPAWRHFDFNRRAFQSGATVRGDFRLGDGRLFLGGGLAFRGFSSHGETYGTLYNDIRVREPIGFLRLAVVALEGVDVFVQAGGGPSFVDLDLHSRIGAHQAKVLGMVDANAGLALYLPKKWLPRRGSSRVTGGLELAAGYTFRSKLQVRPELHTDEDPIETTATDFGDLAVRGFAWRFGLFVRFQ